MPSVASESHPVLPSRPHSPNPRSHSGPDARQQATPFDDLLDSSAPASDPPPSRRQARSERPERADRNQPVRERNADTKPADASADIKDSEPAAGNGGAKASKATGAGETADSNDTTASSDANGKPKPDGDQQAALDAMLIDAVTAPQAVPAAVAQPLALAAATTEGGTPEADALAALQAAGVAPDKTSKPGEARGDKAADAAANAGDAKAGVPEIDAGKDNQARGNGGKSAGEFNRAAADLLAKPDGNVSAQPGADAAPAKTGADPVQNLGVVSPTNPAHPANTATAPAPLPAPAAAVPLSGLAVEIAAQSRAGNKHFEIRLDPPELGRIHVKLDVDGDGNVSTRLVVDRADTLDLLKRDASTLERALQQSGLKTSDNALEFSLRQQGFAQDNAPQNGTHLVVPDDDPAPLEALRQGYGRLLGLGGGLDIRV